MKKNFRAADRAEQIILNCREIYTKYGFRRFIMSKFEDYDLYAGNKNFLISDNVLTFTDRSGRLKALKPDVTLSIVNNIGKSDSLPIKLFYNENVYRPDESGHEFREIMQLGLESIGSDDLYSTAEVIMLAEMSLNEISADHILDISHMGLLNVLTGGANVENVSLLTSAISRRSTDTIRELVADESYADMLCCLVSEYAPVNTVLSKLSDILPQCAALDELKGICKVLTSLSLDKNVYLDFSLVNDVSYYNGIIFKGFISGISSAVLSGGRYDPLLSRFGHSCGACGFAIYLDRIQGNLNPNSTYDADVLVLYNCSCAPEKIAKICAELTSEGKTVMASTSVKDKSRYAEIMEVSE